MYELMIRACNASAKYAATRSGEEPNGDDSSEISGNRLFAWSRLSTATHSAHCSSKPNSLKPDDSASTVRNINGVEGEIDKRMMWKRTRI
ncbi:hypothetical protein HanHA300_Chr17g0676701 [Helianthus annuus]|nr:hypothetical protein HanHA300_Chr17g0676701 [Helianthus annuus]KAJ0449559.1 hypothetical protein HanHA89_Chr17g0729861 [Helianthus annuus]KAJ0638244.1 hypothetical protein HanOQP8_Chr17g0683071 [Helianthus annuus]